MTEIGTTLRETRMREKIDIGTVEASTKIRAKYLRALEHEEWGILPGPAYAKSFLRTYAEFLGLDAHMLVEQYRTQFERPEELELPAFGRPKRKRRRPRFPGPPSSALAVAIVAAVLIGFLFILGVTNKETKGGSSTPTGSAAGPGKASTGATDRANGGASGTSGTTAAGGKVPKVSLAVVPTRDVWVCLVDAKGRLLIGGRTLTAGVRAGPFKSTRFEVTLGNGGGDLRVNGKARPTPDSAVPLGYAITSSGTQPLAAAKRPTCASGTGTP
jgi:cytoskeleton protein RodZ